VYNAQVFFDYLLGKDRLFYKPFYQINRDLDPNVLSQFVLGSLLRFLPFWLAEKIFQCAYILLFALGFRYLLQQINGKQNVYAVLFFPLCFSLPFQMGFYNFCLAIAILFFVLGYVLQHLQKNNLRTVFMGSLLILICTFSHGMIGGVAILFSSILMLTSRLPWQDKFSKICVFTLPSFIVILGFTLKQGLHTTPHSFTKLMKLQNLLRLYANVSTRSAEQIPICIFAILLGILLIGTLLFLRKTISKLQIAFLIFVLYLLVSYINAPGTLAYAGGTDIRLASLFPIFIVLLLQCTTVSKQIQTLVIISGFGIAVSLCLIRLPHIIDASRNTRGLLRSLEKVKPNSVVLKLQHQHRAKESSFQIDNSFLHITDYLGATKQKPLLMVNNFEAEISYFSVQWRPNVNPGISISEIDVDRMKNYEQLDAYEKQIQHRVDYVIWLDSNNTTPENKTPQLIKTKSPMLDSLYANYVCVDSNINWNMRLFERKNR
jgi:hypothetical protein